MASPPKPAEAFLEHLRNFPDADIPYLEGRLAVFEKLAQDFSERGKDQNAELYQAKAQAVRTRIGEIKLEQLLQGPIT